MSSFNKTIIMGNLVRDPEQRFLPSNTAVCSLTVAVNEKWKDKQTGEWVDRCNFIDCEAFSCTAENIAKYFTKGKAILIEGKLRLDQWEDKNTGDKRSKLKVVIERFEFVGSRDEGGGGNNGQQRAAPAQTNAEPVGDDDFGF